MANKRYIETVGRNTRREKADRRTHRWVPNSLLLIVFAVIVALLVIVMPKEPVSPASALLTVTPTDGGVSSMELPLRISEVMASNRRAYPDENGNFPDWIEIENTSQEPINLSGMGLSDREDRVLFLFPEMELAGGSYVVVFCDDTTSARKNAELHAAFKISALGETVYLFDPTGSMIDRVEVPPLATDTSYVLGPGGWSTTESYTPGFPNTEAGYAAFRAAGVLSDTGLTINEIVASNRTTLQDEDGDYPDWIELYNGSDVTIDLHNYCLTDNERNLTKWRFPQGAVIPPGSYYLVYASGKDRTGDAGGIPHASFKLSTEGETVVLADIRHHVIDRIAYENLGKDLSYGRVEGIDSVWQIFQQPTPGLPNNRTGELEMDTRIRNRNQTGIFISEVVTSSTGLETPYGVTSYDWIEIVNRGSQAVNLNGWGLSDSIGRPRKWQFGQVTIQPGDHLLVFTSGLTESPTNSGAIHADFRLSALGETVVLSNPKGVIVDKLVVPKLERDNSYGRNFVFGGLYYFDVPTPGGENTTTGFTGYAVKPVISMQGGVYLKPVTVTISAPEGVRIRYTTDGTDPTERNGIDYEGPITLSDVTPLRARGFADGRKPSDIATETFLINVYHSLPIVAITTDRDNLENPETGILAEDLEVKASYTKVPFKDLTYWKKIPHPANFEYFTPEGQQLVNQGIELQLNGQYSMDQAQKSFRLTARARYGSGTIAYPFFDDRPYGEYQALILRNGGQDGKYTRIIDGLMARIIDWTGADIMTMASRPVIVFLNGEYWGHYNLRERINKHSIAAYEGWTNVDQIDFIKGNNNVISGTFTNYNDLITYVREHDLNDPEALAEVLNWIDVDNYFDFMIFQMYFGNTDAGNIKFYRLRAPGEKWRWVIYDLDWGYFNSATNGMSTWLNPEGAGPQKNTNVLIRKLLDVPEMRDRFLTRFGQLFQDYLSDTDTIRAMADEMIAEIEPELTMHFDRWAGLTSPLVSEEPTTPEGLARYWQTRVDRMHNVLKKRPTLAWEHVRDWFELSDEVMASYFGPQPEMPPDVQ